MKPRIYLTSFNSTHIININGGDILLICINFFSKLIALLLLNVYMNLKYNIFIALDSFYHKSNYIVFLRRLVHEWTNVSLNEKNIPDLNQSFCLVFHSLKISNSVQNVWGYVFCSIAVKNNLNISMYPFRIMWHLVIVERVIVWAIWLV